MQLTYAFWRACADAYCGRNREICSRRKQKLLGSWVTSSAGRPAKLAIVAGIVYRGVFWTTLLFYSISKGHSDMGGGRV